MAAFVNFSDPLTVSIDEAIAGQNFPDNRSIWHSLDDIVFDDGGLTGTQWFRDNGPNGLAASKLEPRAFCTRGGCHFSFNGTGLIVRLNIAFAWFNGATVTIDGAAPSTLGLLSHSDTLSCDAASYPPEDEAKGYIEVVVADGLADTAHDAVVLIDNANAAKFFSIAGFRIPTFTSQPFTRSGAWLVSPSVALLTQNALKVTLTNRSANLVFLPSLTFPPALVLASDGSALAPLAAASLDAGAALSVTLLPAFNGNEHSGAFAFALALSARYTDPDGAISTDELVTASPTANDPQTGLMQADPVVGPVAWVVDTSTPDNTPRIFTQWLAPFPSFPDIKFTVTLAFVGDAVDVTIQQSGGWGVLGVYNADASSLLYSLDCGAGAGIFTQTLSGFGAGPHVILFRKVAEDGLFVVLMRASWTQTFQFSQIDETVSLTYLAQQPVAMPVVDVAIGDYDATFDPPIPDHDFSGAVVRTNDEVVYSEVLSRFATFAVCYQSGFADILGEYDILIIDPIAAHAADVATWQAKGIVVYGYIASGEEVGFYQDRYDFSSALAPNSGSGPGGWAAYYMFTRFGTTGADWVGTWDLPDKNGVWASFYTNPDPAFGWPARVEGYYAPLVLGSPLVVTDEVVTLSEVTISAGTRLVFDTAHAPFDTDQPITLTSLDGMTDYPIFAKFTFDPKTGAVVMAPDIAGISAGTQLKVSYTRKGLNCDGVFWDVVDTPDVFNSHTFEFGYAFVPGYTTEFAAFINGVKANHPDKLFISNRGFTILDDIIASCSGVMFESWLASPTDIEHLATTDYVRITDPDAIAFNDGINDQLRRLRLSNTFDVFSLNYCLPEDTVLRDYMRGEDAKRGYLSWQSTITLNTPAHNTTIDTPGPRRVSTAFERYKRKAV